MTHSPYHDLLAEQRRLMEEVIRGYDPHLQGLDIRCPQCSVTSRILLTEKCWLDGFMPVNLACPTPCGYWGEISTFTPKQQRFDGPSDFDTHYECHHDGVKTQSYGRFIRCPKCAYENCREEMAELVRDVREGVARSSDRKNLADLLSRVVATFDGVMRASNHAVRRNTSSKVPQEDRMPEVHSFQSLRAANSKLQSHFDMSAASRDWDRFVLCFQKRHCFTHTLGIADVAYVAKSGDSSAVVGRGVSLTPDDVIFCAEEADGIVNHFFGHWFS